MWNLDNLNLDIDFQQYWLSLKRRWLPAVAALASVVGLAALSAFLQKPIYEAKGKLLLERADSTASLTGLGTEVRRATPSQ
ncbi:MAG TPA: hypothetical protein V6D03_10125 [Candidatus Caenarcaniphilales bacterium]